MKKFLLANRLVLGIAGLLFLALLGFVLVLRPQAIGLLLLALALVGLVWVGGHFLVQHLRRRRQARFDAGMVAREGIDDRRKEWTSWTGELNKQGIDRYDLPFYLLVGEPQSGKSVLLQNSDLHFPFGQTKLSGAGGTRGCDWWFTEEAVILDLAGRLFTHEGGASDAAEWEAFLRLLSEYRPMCPINGVMLVIPCDSLLSDDAEASSRKAVTIQSALLTLTKELEAQVPIYVVLTKADKILGFAETVHRLEVDQRNQMFGWSRSSEQFEAPFDMVEARQAFEWMIERAKTLRQTMMGSLRLPEGVAEADRMYGFPSELASIQPNLEIYLKRIFSESALVDSCFFRGIYLTSGLQSGAPIARACADLLPQPREADMRDLEALFAKQQAYFIRDLVRRRVFSERGLVRPTSGRLKRARQRSWIGYGVAATVALASVGLGARYLVRESREHDERQSEFRAMLSNAGMFSVDARPSSSQLGSLLLGLEGAAAQIDHSKGYHDAIWSGVGKDSRDLYRTLAEQRLAPLLLDAARGEVRRAFSGPGPDDDTFLSIAESASRTLDGFDLYDEQEVEGFLTAFGTEQLKTQGARLRDALATLRELPGRPLGEGARPDLVSPEAKRFGARSLEEAWDGLLIPGPSWHVRGDLGLLSSLAVADEAQGLLRERDFSRVLVAEAQPSLDAARRYFHAVTKLSGSKLWPESATEVDRQLDAGQMATRLEELRAARDRSLARSELEDRSASWSAYQTVRTYGTAKSLLGSGGEGSVAGSVSWTYIEPFHDDQLRRVCDPDWLPSEAAWPDLLVVPEHLDRVAGLDSKDALSLALLKARAIAERQGDFGDWRELAGALRSEADGENVTEAALALDFLAGVHARLGNFITVLESAGVDARPMVSWRERLEPAVQEVLEEVSESMNSEVLAELHMVRGLRAARTVLAHSVTAEAALDDLFLNTTRAYEEERLDTSMEPQAETCEAFLERVTQRIVALSEGVTWEDYEADIEAWVGAEGDLGRGVEELRLELRGLFLERLEAPDVDLASAVNGLRDDLEEDAFRKLAERSLHREWSVLDDVFTRAPRGADRLGVQADEICAMTARTDLDRLSKLSSSVQSHTGRLRGALQSGPALFAALAEFEAEVVERNLSPTSAGEWFLAERTNQVNGLAYVTASELYLAELEAALEPLPRVMQVLSATEESSGFGQFASELAEQLGAFFGTEGAFESLNQRYPDLPNWADCERRGTGLGLGEERTKALRVGFERAAFLGELAGFLNASNEAEASEVAAEETWSIGIELLLNPSNADTGLWEQDGDYFHAWSLEGSENERRFVGPRTQSLRLQRKAWSFELTPGSSAPEFWVAWTPSTLMDPSVQRLGTRTVLAPALMAWWYSEPEAGQEVAARRWRVRPASASVFLSDSEPDSSDLEGELDLIFDRPLPLRPASMLD